LPLSMRYASLAFRSYTVSIRFGKLKWDEYDVVSRVIIGKKVF